MSDKKNTKDFVHIGNIIPNALKNYRRQPDSGMGKVWEIWNHAVGKMIAENATPSAFKGKLMIVNVSSSAWIQNLQFEKDEIIKKVNAGLGKRQVEDIQFKVGPLK
jgi:predicted nucleic acid-binding Zn ribbon protein